MTRYKSICFVQQNVPHHLGCILHLVARLLFQQIYDKDTIQKSVAKTGRIILAQEGPKCGGWGAELSAMISEDVFEYLCAPIKRVTSLDSPVPYAPVLEDYVLPQLDDLVKTCRELMEY